MAEKERSRTRLALATLALAGGVAIAFEVASSWPFGQGEGYLLAIGGAAITCLVLGLTAIWVRGLAWGLALLGVAFLVRVQLEPATVSGWTPVLAGGLLLVAELGYWSFELDGSSTAGSGSTPRRLLEVLALALAAGAAAELVLDLGSILPLSGPGLLVLGVAAATAVLGIMLQLARRAEA
jgi:hypothetical protein